ncbi:TPA: hypothetical protein ACHVE0_001758, partial [Streptococcus suis]
MLRGNATERVATSCIKATAVIFTALEHSIKLYCALQEFLLKNLKIKCSVTIDVKLLEVKKKIP